MSREIDDLDFNSLRTKIIEILGNGVGSYGYGQEVKSSPVYQGNLITKSQWDGLRYDIINTLVHQTGVTPDVIEIVKGNTVGESDPLLAYGQLIENASLNRFDLDVSQSSITTITTKTFTSQWNTYAYLNMKISFNSADAARYFFNSGGKIRFTSSRSGGSSTPQNGAWSTVLTNIGTVEFGGNSEQLSFYQLTDEYQTLKEQGLSTPYSANVYKIKALCDKADNSQGTATTVTFEITWTDNYSSSVDNVDGTLSLSIEEIKASGLLQPSGEFSIISPFYEISEISAGYNAPPPPPPAYIPPSPPPAITYNEIVSVPSFVSVYEIFSGSITGGAPNTEFSIEWKNSRGITTSAGSARLNSSGNYSSGSIGVFALPDTYTLTVRFSYTGNVLVKTTVVTP